MVPVLTSQLPLTLRVVKVRSVGDELRCVRMCMLACLGVCSHVHVSGETQGIFWRLVHICAFNLGNMYKQERQGLKSLLTSIHTPHHTTFWHCTTAQQRMTRITISASAQHGTDLEVRHMASA